MVTRTPRDLDPKFKDENPEVLPPNENVPATGDERSEEQAKREDSKSDDEPMTVHREKYIDGDGKLSEREHRVPTAEWAAYEKEHGF